MLCYRFRDSGCLLVRLYLGHLTNDANFFFASFNKYYAYIQYVLLAG